MGDGSRRKGGGLKRTTNTWRLSKPILSHAAAFSIIMSVTVLSCNDHIHSAVWRSRCVSGIPSCISFTARRRPCPSRLWFSRLESRARHIQTDVRLSTTLLDRLLPCSASVRTRNMLVILICEKRYRYAPTIDLVLLSHGDLAHSGLYAYAYARWGLKAPAYTTIPVQAMARIATLEDIEGIRDEQDIDDLVAEQALPNAESSPSDTKDRNQSCTEESSTSSPGKYVATVQEVHEAYDAVNTLRYSQPTHLQG